MARRKPRRNISRVDAAGQNGRSRGGWSVRLQRRGSKTSKFFSDSQFGGNRGALSAAKSFRDQMEQAWRRYSTKELARKPTRRNHSGIVGVRLERRVERRGDYEYHYQFWVAQWTDGKGRRKSRAFSVRQLGHREAYRRALAARRRGISR
jgi:hypothetical protein